jgi:hypothetical protein
MPKTLSGILLAAATLALAVHAGEPPANAAKLNYHNGPVLISATAVLIFWGPTFANAGSPDHVYATALQAFRNGLGTTGQYNVITQYYQIVDGTKEYIQLTNLGAGTADWFDTSTPPTDVTDADFQAEIGRYLATHTFDDSTIYEVFIPSTSYASDAGEDSCGGPNVMFCGYHSSFLSGADTVIYSVQPYPSCSACQATGATATLNQEHFVCHDTRETVTDPLGTGWWSTTSGKEADDLCPGGYSAANPCGTEWSNAAGKCVATM